MMKKRVLALLLAGAMVMALAACGDKQGDTAGSGKLVIYTAESDEVVNLVIPAFKEATGIEVEVISAKTGELMKRIENEANNPQADIMLGSNSATLSDLKSCFEDYTSANDANMAPGFQNDNGCFTPYKADGSVLIVNKTKLAELGIEVKGYEDLLQPELKGKIALGDSASSSSAREHLLNVLVDFGNGANESDEGWEYMRKLLENAEGKILESSGAVYKGVADGEYVVGMSYENPCITLKRDGADVDVIYMEEGTVFAAATVQIIKGCANLENAKKFVDFVTSAELQDRMGTEACVRPLRAGAKVADYMIPLEDIVQTSVDRAWAGANKDAIANKFTDLVTDLG